MKTLVVYSSQTGFTKRYAEWISQETDAELLTFNEAKKKKAEYFDSFDAIVYGGWAKAGKIVNSNWFLNKSKNWKSKCLVLFCVGASPIDSPDLELAMSKMLSNEEKKYIKLFYCPGGLDYSKMHLLSKVMMKGFSAALKRSKDIKKREQGETVSHSYNISDKKYIQPMLDYMKPQ